MWGHVPPYDALPPLPPAADVEIKAVLRQAPRATRALRRLGSRDAGMSTAWTRWMDVSKKAIDLHMSLEWGHAADISQGRAA